MTAISANTTRIQRNTGGKCVEDYAVATATTLYVGELVMIVASSGRLTTGATSATAKFAGIVESLSTTTGTGNTAGSVTARVAWGHEVRLACATAVDVASIGCNCTLLDNNTVTTASATTSTDVLVGEVIAKVSTNVAWVAMRRFSTLVV